MKTVPPPTRSEEPDPGSYSWKLLLIKDARVHYVVLKQQPQTTHPTHTNMRDRCSQETRNKQTRKHTTAKTMIRSTALLPQDPTVCQTLNHPFPDPAVPGHTIRRPGIRTREGEEQAAAIR